VTRDDQGSGGSARGRESVHVERVDFINVPTRDYERAIAFYRDILELPQNPRDPTEFEAENVTLALFDPTEVGLEFATNGVAQIALRVADVATTRLVLEKRGVRFEGVKDTGVCHMAFFSDPDGNSLMLHRRYAPNEERAE
jgi:catechol 2,3-dioxygenase-like lactoylglutathione lyase family enzyme